MELLNKDEKKIEYDNIDKEKKEIIKILLNEDINIENYLWIDFDSNLLVEYINKKDQNLKIKLLRLSLTDKYDSDMRRRIDIDVDDKPVFNYFIGKLLNLLEQHKDKKEDKKE